MVGGFAASVISKRIFIKAQRKRRYSKTFRIINTFKSSLGYGGTLNCLSCVDVCLLHLCNPFPWRFFFQKIKVCFFHILPPTAMDDIIWHPLSCLIFQPFLPPTLLQSTLTKEPAAFNFGQLVGVNFKLAALGLQTRPYKTLQWLDWKKKPGRANGKCLRTLGMERLGISKEMAIKEEQIESSHTSGLNQPEQFPFSDSWAECPIDFVMVPIS